VLMMKLTGFPVADRGQRGMIRIRHLSVAKGPVAGGIDLEVPRFALRSDGLRISTHHLPTSRPARRSASLRVWRPECRAMSSRSESAPAHCSTASDFDDALVALPEGYRAAGARRVAKAGIPNHPPRRSTPARAQSNVDAPRHPCFWFPGGGSACVDLPARTVVQPT
jgi:hypothetical protein